MKSILSKIFIFAAGAAIGSAVAWKLTSLKYEAIIQEEVDSVKAELTKFYSREIEESPDDGASAVSDEEKEEVKNIISEQGYSIYTKENTGVNDVEDKPYVISPEEYGELYGYETISLTYYSDEVLTDDMNEIIDDVEAIVGLDSLTHFGEYEDDSVFVRNDRLKCDYEILLDNRTYSGMDE